MLLKYVCKTYLNDFVFKRHIVYFYTYIVNDIRNSYYYIFTQ
jgi:hypothetical protein